MVLMDRKIAALESRLKSVQAENARALAAQAYGDPVMLPDYASAVAGAHVVHFLTSKSHSFIKDYEGGEDIKARPPVTALTPDISLGNCWAFAGSRGHIGIVLSRIIKITHITLDHPPIPVLFDWTSAPRQFSLWAFSPWANELPGGPNEDAALGL